MAAVRLGKIHLRWCRACNLPVLERELCGKCGEKTFPVMVTPPGDARPAFQADIDNVRRVADARFGEGCGKALVPDGKLMLLNRVPSLDSMDEVIIDGEIVASMRYDPGRGWNMLPRMPGARRMAANIAKSWAIIDDGAIQPMIMGASPMAVGVLDCDTGIEVGDEVIVLTKERKALSVGVARMTGAQMKANERGPAAKNRVSEEPADPKELPACQTWDDAVKASSKALDKRRSTARKFVRDLEKRGKPIAVSFSGGKDSLAVLLVALEAGLKPPLLFVDTGIELPETIAYVHETAKHYGLELAEEKATESFWKGVQHFGPPAKDFRWCCKTTKLGPTSRIIRRRFPGGVLSLIGQRRYESEQRSKKGSIWLNPWVPGQDAASPIQDWTALHVWLYIFQQKAPYNIWYERGMPRIGCWTCPSADLADQEVMKKGFPGYEKWTKILRDWVHENGLPEEWVELALWRWKRDPSPEIMALVKVPTERRRSTKRERELTGEEKERVEELLFMAGGDRESVNGKGLIARALYCQGCGICIARCPEEALELREGKLRLDATKCKKCLVCMSPCPVADFEPR